MNINLEAAEQHAIQAYGDNKIQINSIIYEGSLIVSREEIITDVAINNIQNMNDEYLNLLLKSTPEIIIIGHENTGKFPPFSIISHLSKQRIGIECMSIGAACRTYNVLLSEHRQVVAGIII
ncbi:Mth938-like domain-containing protein [uncultured Legionella sp.]|uniref:Mth938-like domain-containing protein n=1 Tax=uncultured Legionella sp. TaxID=210934 RepID=UPI00262B4AF1|nr:Mth938-like domain-containing protein [uncultured Legionella sp.]